MRLNILYENREGFGNDLFIVIRHGKKILNEARIKISGRNKDEITNAKLRFISDFCKENPDILPKDILRAFAVTDEVFKNLYKTQYPHGGYRGGGRPKGTTKTETLNQRLTPAEKTFLLDQLARYRKFQKETWGGQIMSKNDDLIIWFDSKTGEAMPKEKQGDFIKEVQSIALKYDFDFYMSGSPESINNMLKRLEIDGYFEDELK